jgi:acyl-CoA thioester hydrolase
MQETAFDASAAVGYDLKRYRAMGRLWLVRETDITYLRPLLYGDTVIVKTWVADFRRVRSRRLYELRVASNNEMAATAATDWVFLDPQTLQPARIPPEMVAAFLPETGRQGSRSADGARREPFPHAPPPPPGTFRLRHPVEWRDIDPAGHVNNANYLAYIEECNTQVAAAHGWPMTRIIEYGFGIVARRYRIEYREPALMGDELEIATYISDVKRATAVRHYTVRRVADGVLLARAHVLWAWIDLESGRPRRIPPEFMADFRPNISIGW